MKTPAWPLVRGVLLFLWAVLFASAVRVTVLDGAFGDLTFAMAVWMGFYPLAMASGIGTSRYWRMLILFVGVGTLLGRIELPPPFPGVVVAAILALSFAGMLRTWWRRDQEKRASR